MKSYGQIAYEGYYFFSGGKSLVSGAPLPEWPMQNEKIREAWEEAARAVLRSFGKGDVEDHGQAQ